MYLTAQPGGSGTVELQNFDANFSVNSNELNLEADLIIPGEYQQNQEPLGFFIIADGLNFDDAETDARLITTEETYQPQTTSVAATDISIVGTNSWSPAQISEGDTVAINLNGAEYNGRVVDVNIILTFTFPV